MPVCGLVVSVVHGAADRVAAQIEEAGPFTLGEQIGCRLTAAAETEDAASAERWHDWLRQLPGVVKMDVAFVSWDRAEGSSHAD